MSPCGFSAAYEERDAIANVPEAISKTSNRKRM